MDCVTAILVDDEPLARDLLREILKEHEDIDLCAECASGWEAVDAVQQLSPDLMFLDVEMPELSGFDVISQIQADIMPRVIFTTAWAKYAVDAFRVNAVDYVLKPLSDEAVFESIERAKALLNQEALAAQKPNMLEALNQITETTSEIEQRGEPRNQLIVRESDRLAILEHAEISWVEAAGDYVCIHAAGETHVMRATLKSVLDELPEDHFQRIHRSSVINLGQLKGLVPAPKGEAFAVMKDGKKLKVSRGHSSELKSRITHQ